jgi:hypothetical protein
LGLVHVISRLQLLNRQLLFVNHFLGRDAVVLVNNSILSSVLLLGQRLAGSRRLALGLRVPLLDLNGLHLICGLGAYFLVLLNEVSVSGHGRDALALPEGSSVVGLVALARVTHPKDLAGK